MWNFFKRRNKEQDSGPEAQASKIPDIRRIEANDNAWQVNLLEVHPVTLQMHSYSQNPDCASNAVSYRQDDGTSFIGASPSSTRTLPTNLYYRIDGMLAEGALFLPQVMEHKWALYYHRGQILCIRSWLRHVEVIAEVDIDSNQARITNVRGMFLLPDEPPEFTIRVLDYLLRSHALGQVYPAPVPEEVAQDPQKAAMWCFASYGKMAVFATSASLPFEPPEAPLRTYSLLHIAAAHADLKAVNALLSQGLSIDLPDRDGQSPLHWALNAQGLDAASYFLDHGAQVDFRDPEGATPLMQMVQLSQRDKVAFLLEHGADPNAEDTRGFAALHRAAYLGNRELVQLLLDYKAVPNLEVQGQTPRSLAASHGHQAIVSLLDQWIAQSRG
jgi:hypothetical protein